MAFRQWIIGLLGGTTEDQSKQLLAAPPAADSAEEEAEGLNFRTAIEAHQKWKARLQAVIDHNSSENLSVEVISQDDQCVLGKWIHGVGRQRFGTDGVFQRLRKNHADFHLSAGKVLALARAGNEAESRMSLKSGDYALLSQDVVLDLAEMYQHVSGKQS